MAAVEKLSDEKSFLGALERLVGKDLDRPQGAAGTRLFRELAEAANMTRQGRDLAAVYSSSGVLPVPEGNRKIRRPKRRKNG